jgi:hypothetical protein
MNYLVSSERLGVYMTIYIIQLPIDIYLLISNYIVYLYTAILEHVCKRIVYIYLLYALYIVDIYIYILCYS